MSLTSSHSKADAPKNIFLIGPPNCGKTTLFNWLTGFKNKIVNYPGSTVFISKGTLLKKYGYPVEVIDSPGTYSFQPQSDDERITIKTLSDNKNSQIVVLVLDASKLEVQLPLFFKLQQKGYPVLIALTMLDILPESLQPQVKTLSQKLKAPVVSVKGLTGEGVLELIEEVKAFQTRNKEFNKRGKDDIGKTDEAFKKGKHPVIPVKTGIQKLKKKEIPAFAGMTDSAGGQSLEKSFQEDKTLFDYCKQIVQESLIKKAQTKDNSQDLKKEREKIFLSEKWDRFFLHPKMGFLVFAVFMFSLFSSVFWLASPFMDFIDSAFSKLIDFSSQALSFSPQLADLISNGMLAGLGAVLIFVPQIFILFVGISLLEDSGYLARAVSLMDGPFSKIGLSGRSFVPFLSGYACAIPSILLAKTLSSKREKLMVFFSVPFMSCSARLPVYALLLSFLFYQDASWKAGLSLTVIYLSSFLIGMICVAFLNRFLKAEKSESFILDLPVYRRPSPLKVLNRAMSQSQHYILKAGPPIFFLSIFIWALTNYPSNPALSEAEQASQSWGAQLGLILEPVFQFIGMDWRVGFALIVAFVAREVFVSALLLIFMITKGSEETLMNSLLETMKTASHSDGSLIFTTAGVMGLIVFFMFSLQCLSTSAVVYKESGSLKFAVIQFIALNVLAYLMAVICYQSFKLFL